MWVCRAAPNGTGSDTCGQGTLSLHAALKTRTGEIVAQTVPRHSSEGFVEFLDDIVSDPIHRITTESAVTKY